MPTAPPVDLARDRVLGVETPERVSIEYPLAGPGSRFAALLIDGAIVVLLALVAPILVLIPLGSLGLLGGFGYALLILWFFAVYWGYFIWYEAFRDGQTPGKRRLSIRVVMEDGTPVTLEAAAIRNLLRLLVDFQPGISCLVGGFFMLVGSKSRRLGDIAAGTVVVREQPIEFPRLDELKGTAAPPRLDDARYRVLETFAEQHSALEHEARVRVAARLEAAFAAEITELIANDPREELRQSGAAARVLALYAEESARRRAARLRMNTGSPAASALLQSKRARWETFRHDVAALSGRGLRKLGERQVALFAARYRELSADLARARTYGASSGTIWALERLAGAAHNLFYRPVQRPLTRTGRFLAGGFPRLVRQRALPILVATALLYGPALLAFVLVTTNPEAERRLADPEIVARAERALVSDADYRDTWNDAWLGNETLSLFLIANNIQVAFLEFAGGVIAGLGTIIVLVFNGLHLGTAFAVFDHRGVLSNIGLFVLPHGFIELTAIAIAGGAGLWMGSGLVLPGRKRRLEAFAERAKEAVALIGGVAAMLLCAGIIEGFISPSRTSPTFKVLVGAVAAALTLHYFLVVGRATAPRPA